MQPTRRIDFGPLRERNFRNLWIGRTASVVGDSLAFVALAFAVLAVNGSGTDLGLVIMSYSAPSVIFLLVGGVWADRIPRWAVMIGADVVRGVAQLVLAIAVLSGNPSIPLFMLVALASGIATAFFQPASIGLVPQVVSQERLQQGNAMLNLSQSVSQLFGPVLSGILVIAIGSGWVFAIDAVSFAISAAALWSLKLELPPREAHGSFAGDLAAGWREVRKRAWLPPSLLAFAFANLAFASFMVLGPATMQADYGGAADWGLILAAFGVGGLIGGAAALRWKPRRPLISVFVLMAVNAVRLLVLAVLPPLPAILLIVTVAAAATTLGDTIWHTTVQTQVPARSLSRVSSYDWMVSLLFFPVGAAVAGPLAEVVGASTALVIFAAVSSVPSLLVLLVPAVRSITRRDGAVEDDAPADAGDLTLADGDARLQPAA
jgi:MFS family permease